MDNIFSLNDVDDFSDFDLAMEPRDSPVSPSPTGSKFTPVNVKREAEEDLFPSQTPTKKAKATPKKPKKTPESTPAKKKAKAMGDCYEGLAPEDKMVIDWHEAGKNSKEIADEWKRMTSTITSASSMRGRLARLKAAIANVEPADCGKIETCRMECLQEIEAQKVALEAQRKALDGKLWSLVAEKMKAKGTKDYAPATIEKQWKKMSKSLPASEDATMDEE